MPKQKKDTNVDTVREVVQAIQNMQDHGDDCGCTICQKDAETIKNNPNIVDAVFGLIKKDNHH